MALFISPIEGNADLSLPMGLQFQAATESNIIDFLEKTLPQRQAELFYFFWGGHGLMNIEDERRLFYADASEKNLKNLDLKKLLNFLRSDYFLPSLSKQIFLVDTCANYVDNRTNLKNRLPNNTFPLPSEKRKNVREQFVLMAAKPGEYAKNLGAEKTGLFSKELMAQLESQPEWPPNMDTVLAALRQRFAELREAGQSTQTPTYFYYKDWDSNEAQFKMPNRNDVKVENANEGAKVVDDLRPYLVDHGQQESKLGKAIHTHDNKRVVIAQSHSERRYHVTFCSLSFL